LILLVEEEVKEPIAQSNVDVGLLGPLCELGQCKNNLLFEQLKEFWIMYRPAYQNDSTPVVEEYILGLFGLGAMTMEKEMPMPKVKVVESVDGILDGFDLDSE
jgi:hypothetical protein